MTTALTFDDYSSELASADAGAHADETWKSAALNAIRSLANGHDFITAEMVWGELGKLDVSTHEARALGSVFVAAKKAHIVEATGQLVKCRRSVRKGGFQMSWRSLVVSGSEVAS